MALGDRIVVMEHGKVAQVGTPRDIYQRPATPFVADFIGTMNRVPGKVADGGFVTSAGTIPWAAAPPQATEAMFRPQDVSLAEDGEAHLRGTIAAAFFLGDRTRLAVNVGGDKPLILETGTRRDFRHGETVALRIDPHGLLSL